MKFPKPQILLAAIALLVLNTACTAKPPSCADHFADGAPPTITRQSLASKTQQLCFAGYAVMHSGVSRTPLCSAEHLTPDRVQQAKGMKRQNAFHAEELLPVSERAELKDYVRSGYDRGHMQYPPKTILNEQA